MFASKAQNWLFLALKQKKISNFPIALNFILFSPLSNILNHIYPTPYLNPFPWATLSQFELRGLQIENPSLKPQKVSQLKKLVIISLIVYCTYLENIWYLLCTISEVFWFIVEIKKCKCCCFKISQTPIISNIFVMEREATFSTVIHVFIRSF